MREASTGTKDDGATAAGVLSIGYLRLTIGIVVMVLVHAFEATAASTAMPMIAADLGGVGHYTWAFSGYTGASILGMAFAGRLCDRLGACPPYLISAALFVAGLLVGGFSPLFPVFVAGRVAQGFGAGIYIVTVYFAIARLYPENLRAKMFGLMPMCWAVAALAGPQIAGLVATSWNWRAIFLAVPVLVVVAVLVVAPMLARKRSIVTSADASGPRLPLGALLIVALAVAVLQFAGQRITWGSLVLVPIAVVSLAASLPKLFPVVKLDPVPVRVKLIACRSLLSAAFVASSPFVPLMLARERGLAVAAAGTALTATALAWALGGWLQAQSGPRLSHHRLLWIGSGLTAVGVICQPLALLDSFSPYIAVAFSGIGGLGMGLAVPGISLLLFQQTSERDQGTYASLLQLADSLGCVIALAVTGAIFAALHGERSGSDDAFTVVFAVSCCFAVVAVLLAGQLARPSDSPPA